MSGAGGGVGGRQGELVGARVFECRVVSIIMSSNTVSIYGCLLCLDGAQATNPGQARPCEVLSRLGLL